MLGAGGGLDRLNRLAVRLVALLSLALLPIGLIAALQTYRMLEDAAERAETALLGQTARAADFERQLIQTAIGAGQAFGVAMPHDGADARACDTLFRRFVQASASFDFAGFVDPSGQLICGSHHDYMDVAASPVFDSMRSEPRITARPDHHGPKGGGSLIMIGVPVFDEAERFIGAITIAIPHAALEDRPTAQDTPRPLALAVFNAEGEVMSANREDLIARWRPDGHSLADLAAIAPARVDAAEPGGPIFSVVPVVNGTVFAVAVWSPDSAPEAPKLLSLPLAAFPVLMWLVSLSVAFWAMHRLVVRPIRRLRHRIRVFSSARRTLDDPGPHEMPAELREVSDAFQAMTAQILEDEATAEKALVEKNVLLKELNHRVKNNLQLITSILSLQIRRCRSDETKGILRRLQSRVLGLAAIHQNLYEASALSRVRADELLRQIVSQMLSGASTGESRIAVTREMDALTLYPDQAIPLALLANEAVTNARKYLGAAPGETPWIDIKLNAAPTGEVTLTVRNSLGEVPVETDPFPPGQGLGTELIDAFALQLDARVARHTLESEYRLTVDFQVSKFDAAADADAATTDAAAAE